MSTSFREDWRVGSALLAALLALGIIGGVLVYWFTPAIGAPLTGKELIVPVGPLCSDDPKEIERVRVLIDRGVDEALEEHVKLLMGIWIKDDVNQANRAATGLRNGTRAFFHARKQIDAWVIPPCKQ
jgi:hypothetical protein